MLLTDKQDLKLTLAFEDSVIEQLKIKGKRMPRVSEVVNTFAIALEDDFLLKRSEVELITRIAASYMSEVMTETDALLAEAA